MEGGGRRGIPLHDPSLTAIPIYSFVEVNDGNWCTILNFHTEANSNKDNRNHTCNKKVGVDLKKYVSTLIFTSNQIGIVSTI